MTAVTVGSSDLFGEFCPSVPLAFIAPYTATVVRGLNPILDQKSVRWTAWVTSVQGQPSRWTAGRTARTEQKLNGKPEAGQPWRGPQPSVQPTPTPISSAEVRQRARLPHPPLSRHHR